MSWGGAGLLAELCGSLGGDAWRRGLGGAKGLGPGGGKTWLGRQGRGLVEGRLGVGWQKAALLGRSPFAVFVVRLAGAAGDRAGGAGRGAA